MKVLRERETNVPLIATLAVTIIVGAGLIWYFWPHARTTMKPTPASLQTQKPATHHDEPPAKSTGPSVEELVRGVAHKGEGVERPLIRHLVDDPNAAYKISGNIRDKFTGDITRPRAVKRWAQHEAHLLAIRAGYFQRHFGTEVWVIPPDTVSFVLQKGADGTLQIAEYPIVPISPTPPAPASSGNTLTLAAAHTVAPTIAASTFFGVSPVTGEKQHVPPYEYVYEG